jgi:phage gpG-like protein
MLEFRIGGLDETLSALDRFSDEMVDFRRVEPQLEERFHEAERGQFDSQGARGGTAWVELSEAYAVRKAKEFPGKPIEQRTGALYRALTSTTPDSINRVSKEEFEFGVDLPYARAQAEGTGTIPARPLIALTGEDERAFGQIIEDDAIAHARSLGLDAE